MLVLINPLRTATNLYYTEWYKSHLPLDGENVVSSVKSLLRHSVYPYLVAITAGRILSASNFQL
jgi:hypothetical protein